MNTKELHNTTKAISTAPLFKTTEGSVMSIQILANEQLKEHITKVPAFLLCVTGNVVFENENGIHLTLTTGDYVHIEPNVRHWLNANQISDLVLVK